MDLAQCGLKRDNNLMEVYNSLGCGKNVTLENCSYYKYKLSQSPNDVNFKSKFDSNKCNDVLSANLTNTVNNIYDTYSDYDKLRIQTESKYQSNKKIFFGGMILLSILGVFLIRRK
jgi:hypothetical protein